MTLMDVERKRLYEPMNVWLGFLRIHRKISFCEKVVSI